MNTRAAGDISYWDVFPAIDNTEFGGKQYSARDWNICTVLRDAIERLHSRSFYRIVNIAEKA